MYPIKTEQQLYYSQVFYVGVSLLHYTAAYKVAIYGSYCHSVSATHWDHRLDPVIIYKLSLRLPLKGSGIYFITHSTPRLSRFVKMERLLL